MKQRRELFNFFNKYKIILGFLIFTFAFIRLILSFSSNAVKSSNSSFDLQNLSTQIAISRLTQSINNLSQLEDLRKEALASLGLNNGYRLSRGIFLSDLNKCQLRSKESYYSENVQSIETSEPLECEVWVNPLLLIFPRFYSVSSLEGNKSKISSAPGIDRLSFDKDNKTIKIAVNLSSAIRSEISEKNTLVFMPITMNAFDLGYNSVKIDFEESKNVRFWGAPDNNLKAFGTDTLYACMETPDDQSQETGQKSFNEVHLHDLPEMELTLLPATLKFDLFKLKKDQISEDKKSVDVSVLIEFL